MSGGGDGGGLERAVRDEWGRVVAGLARRLGDLELAEDAVQDAVVAALEHWPREGVPANPGAWLALVARRKALDRLRREQLMGRTARELRVLHDLEAGDDEPARAIEAMTGLPDDRLAMLCACCHPALALDARVALTLRMAGGLQTEKIAAAFMVPVPTMAQRLVRAKRKIRAAAIPLEMPGADALAERLDGVLGVIYLVFNEGYAASAGDALVRRDLCREAIRLGRVVHGLMPEHAEAAGLLALMLLHDARADARVDASGAPVPLDAQDRTRWDGARIRRAAAILTGAVARGEPGPYQLQAAIAAEHVSAARPDDTDRERIARLYDRLHAIDPSPAVAVNRAVAVGRARGPAAGLAALAPLDGDRAMDAYAPYHAARAELLERAGDAEGAAAARAAAVASSANAVVRDFVARHGDPSN